MAFKILDRARMSVSGAPGSGQITLGSAVLGYQTFTQAGISNGDSFSYSVIDGNNWEYGVATYASSGSKLTRAVDKTSAQNSTPLNLSSSAVVTAGLRAEDLSGATSFAGLTDVEVTPGPSTDGWVVYYKDADASFELKALAYSDLSGAPTIPNNSGFNLHSLGDVNMSPTAFTDGYAVTWNNSSSKFVLTPLTTGASLAALSDVTLSSPSNGQAIIYNSGTGKWGNVSVPGGSMATLSDVTFTTLTTNQTMKWNGTAWVNVPFPAGSLVGLTDVTITTGSGVDGYSVVWNNSAGKFELSNISGGGGGGSALAILNNGSSVDTAAVSINFVNATNVTTSSHAVTVTLPTGGGGAGGSMTPPTVAQLAAVTNLGSAVLTARSSGVLVPNLNVTPDVSAATSTLYCALEAAPVGHFSVVTRVRRSSYNISGGWYGAGPVLHNSANSNNVYLMELIASPPPFYVVKWTGGFTSNTFAGGLTSPDDDHFLHLDYDGTNYTFSMSKNGADKVQIFTEAVATFMGAITHVGIGWSGAYANTTGPIFDFEHYHSGAAGTNGL